MCCVMPPASPATTFVLRIRSSSSVFPWSTWPITVTTGGLGFRSSGLSSTTSASGSAPYSSSRTAVKPNSSSSISIWSKSSRWLMVTRSCRFLNAEPMMSVEDTPISSASSATVRNSFTRTVFRSRSSSCRSCSS